MPILFYSGAHNYTILVTSTKWGQARLHFVLFRLLELAKT